MVADQLYLSEPEALLACRDQLKVAQSPQASYGKVVGSASHSLDVGTSITLPRDDLQAGILAERKTKGCGSATQSPSLSRIPCFGTPELGWLLMTVLSPWPNMNFLASAELKTPLWRLASANFHALACLATDLAVNINLLEIRVV